MVKRLNENGFVKFFPLGWNFSQQLLDHRVIIHTRKGPVLGVLIGVLKNLAGAKHPNTVFATGSVQEEITLSGAKTVVAAVKPDIAITLDIDVTSDIPAYTSEDYAQPVLGKGVVIILHTSEMLPHVKLRQWVQGVADEMKIPYQFMLEEGGGTDAGPIHQWSLGVPTLDLVISQRYYHSANGIIHRDDYESAVRLITEAVKRLDKNVLDELMFKPLSK
jgi:endoglucanase